MSGGWVSAIPALTVAAVVVFGPGLVIGAAFRLRGLALVGLAPVLGVATIAVVAIAYGVLGVPWALWTVGLAVVAVATIAWLSCRRLPLAGGSARSRMGVLLLAGGLAAGGVIGALRLALYMGDPAAVSQTNDAVFHLNALRWIAETGSASSLDLTGVVGSSSFYPAAWHAVTSLVVAASGASIPVAANAVSFVLVALIWPLGIAWLAEAIVHPVAARAWAPAVPAAAGALSAGLLTFPLLMLEWGVLYPYALALAVVPAAAAAVLVTPQWMSGADSASADVRAALRATALILIGVTALALAQPSALLVWGVVVVIWYVGWVVLRLRDGDTAHRGRWVLSAVGAAVAFAGLWGVLSQGTSGAQWAPFRGRVAAVADVVLNGQVLLPYSIAMSILMMGGLALAVWEHALRWLVGVWLVFSALYWVAATVASPEIREVVLGAWYSDPYRLAALAPLTAVPLAALAFAWIADRVLAWLSHGRRSPDITTGWAVLAATAIGGVSLALTPVVQMPNIVGGYDDAQTRYTSNADSYLSPDERALLERLAASVPEDALVIGSPSTGSGFGYLFSGRFVYPRTWATPQTEAWQLLGQHLREAATDPEVCEALDIYGNPDFVLDFGSGDQTPGRYILPGFTDFVGQPGFELVDRQGSASLWRITACERQ